MKETVTEPAVRTHPFWRYGFGAVIVLALILDGFRHWRAGTLVADPMSTIGLVLVGANYWVAAFLSPTEQTVIRRRYVWAASLGLLFLWYRLAQQQ